MTKKRFGFKRFDIDVTNLNEISLYMIDNNPSDVLDESNLFYVYSTTDVNVQQIVDKLNIQEERIKELENKLNKTALEFLNYELITMGKAVEISEMSYYHFLKYRAEHRMGKCYSCVSFDELSTGEFFCKRYQEIIDESKVINEENCEDWVGMDRG